jgi:hypothetical protein
VDEFSILEDKMTKERIYCAEDKIGKKNLLRSKYVTMNTNQKFCQNYLDRLFRIEPKYCPKDFLIGHVNPYYDKYSKD